MGVFPADHIPMRWPRPYALIANTDNHDKPGTHWIAVYLTNNGNAIYFDSYGLPPIVHQHHQRVTMNSRNYKWNTKRLQSFNSSVCGQYCVMFLHYMSRGYSLEKFCNLFSNDCKNNDMIVQNFYSKVARNSVKRHKPKNNYVLKGYGKKCKTLCIQSCRPEFSKLKLM